MIAFENHKFTISCVASPFPSTQPPFACIKHFNISYYGDSDGDREARVRRRQKMKTQSSSQIIQLLSQLFHFEWLSTLLATLNFNGEKYNLLYKSIFPC